MACPYFLPVSKLDDNAWDPPPRMPLGASWWGECSLAPGAALRESELREHCNLGYARGKCARFPHDAEFDAYRFSHSGTQLIFIRERAHSPLTHGLVQITHQNTPLDAQARAFLSGRD